jgi:alkyl hydroperoxide reductase subunit AhpC
MSEGDSGPLVGTLVPEFDLPCTRTPDHRSGRASLKAYRGRWLVLFFYPKDFSLICPTEILGFSSRIEEFRKQGCEILGVSCDTLASHELWIATPRSQNGLGGLSYPLASDTDGTLARALRVYQIYQRTTLRGLFILDPNGVIQYEVVHNMSVGRRARRAGFAPRTFNPDPNRWTRPSSSGRGVSSGIIGSRRRSGKGPSPRSTGRSTRS